MAAIQHLFDPNTTKSLQRLETVFTIPEFRNDIARVTEGFQDFTLTAAQMDTLNATPVTVLAVPFNSGALTVVTGIWTYVVFNSVAFSLGSGVLSYLYTDGSGAKVVSDVPNAQVASASTTSYWSPTAAVVPVTNAVIVAKTSADVTAGDGTVYGRIFYRSILPSDVTSTVGF